MPRSYVTGSKSENESVVGAQVPAAPAKRKEQYVIEPVQKRPDGIDTIVLEALKGGGHVSACTRGGPLSMRLCQVCKDVARECREGVNCKFLTTKIQAHLYSSFPQRADEKEMASEVFRFIKELATSSENIRAKQVMASNLKPESNLLLQFVRKHNEVLQKLSFLQQKQLESKSLQQVEAEVPIFLQGIKADCEKADVQNLVDKFKLLEDFVPFFQKAKAEAAETKKKSSMHGDEDIVDKFLSSQKFKGDREFTKAFLLMSTKNSPSP